MQAGRFFEFSDVPLCGVSAVPCVFVLYRTSFSIPASQSLVAVFGSDFRHPFGLEGEYGREILQGLQRGFILGTHQQGKDQEKIGRWAMVRPELCHTQEIAGSAGAIPEGQSGLCSHEGALRISRAQSGRSRGQLFRSCRVDGQTVVSLLDQGRHFFFLVDLAHPATASFSYPGKRKAAFRLFRC